jgi:hypothetical protein
MAVLACSWGVHGVVALFDGQHGTALVEVLFGVGFALVVYVSLRRDLPVRRRMGIIAMGALSLAIALLLDGLGVGRFSADRVVASLAALCIIASLGMLLVVVSRPPPESGA